MDVLAGKRRFRWFLSLLVLSVVFSFPLAFSTIKTFYPFTQNMRERVLSFVDDAYPAELQVVIRDGSATTNVTEPYYVTVPSSAWEKLFSPGTKTEKTLAKTRLLAIDTQGRADDFEQYQSFALLTKNSLVTYSQKDNKIQLYPLREVPNMTIEKGTVRKQITSWFDAVPLEKISKGFLWSLPVLFAFFSLTVMILAMLVYGFIVYVMARLNQLPIPYSRAFVYTVAVSFLLNIVENTLGLIPGISQYTLAIPSAFTMVLLGLCYLGIRTYKQTQQI